MPGIVCRCQRKERQCPKVALLASPSVGFLLEALSAALGHRLRQLRRPAGGSLPSSGFSYTKQMRQPGHKRRNSAITFFRISESTECPINTASTASWLANNGASSGVFGETTENPASARMLFLASRSLTFRLIERTRDKCCGIMTATRASDQMWPAIPASIAGVLFFCWRLPVRDGTGV